VVTATTSLSPLDVLGNSALGLTLSYSADANHSLGIFTSGSATVNSGDGQQFVFDIAGVQGFANLIHVFQYLNAGHFTTSFDVEGVLFEPANAGFTPITQNVSILGTYGTVVANGVAAVPEPSTWAMMILGFMA
jgi:hypothetical protein